MCCEKWLQGVGAFPDPAEQEDPNKSRGAGCPVLMCHFMACQNGYWVTPTHSVMKMGIFLILLETRKNRFFMTALIAPARSHI